MSSRTAISAVNRPPGSIRWWIRSASPLLAESAASVFTFRRSRTMSPTSSASRVSRCNW